MKIFITMPKNPTTDSFLTPRNLELLHSIGEVVQNPYDHNLKVEEVLELAQDADVLITCWGTCLYHKEDVLKMPNLKLIAHFAGSVAPVVAQDVYETDVKVISGNDVFAKSVAEGCLCYTLAALRRLEHYMDVMRTGGFKETVFYNRGLFGKKLGIVGFGAIARHYLNLVRWFDLEVLIYSSHLTDEEAAKYGGRTASLEEIFSECDVISIHASNTAKTRGMITRELMERMKPDALLVNTARGAVIDEPAMFEMLLAGKFYAALDVYAEEPPAPDAPIRQCKNALLMPHMGGPTMDMRSVVALEVTKDIARLGRGEELQYEITAAAAARMTGG
jgi:phosphoglycerate dehydrogenase-like enzyme